MNGDLNKKLTEFFQTRMPESTINENDVIWLYSIFKMTKAQQKAEFIAWLNERKATIATQVSAEPTVSATKLTKLNDEDDVIDTIISTF